MSLGHRVVYSSPGRLAVRRGWPSRRPNRRPGTRAGAAGAGSAEAAAVGAAAVGAGRAEALGGRPPLVVRQARSARALRRALVLRGRGVARAQAPAWPAGRRLRGCPGGTAARGLAAWSAAR